ncbi:MAG: DJ-1/PfpI family protein [Rhodospirillaceae bacterium]|jgi:protease I|nr:DJ-1/PfpI family protein [Rhodospirillaceae bacterium]MBT3491046.1 DJ-1/PfpI family protein [Rhodospirillaceae bacterium]MBT3781687.1 DJ-1/PfpI family protein [Rhodospirillaceae bacterium]MBT3975277.1 DJ-1/PfpI family protein [Rhodospirillaceae bacterium]MBT4169644.1 DJ-1/PfpI family protein [Rhodospirillaceae bacterium]
MSAKKILMLVGEFSEEYEIFVFQQAFEAVGHTVDIVCPDTKAGFFLTTSVHDFGPDLMTWSEHRGHNVEITKDFDAVDTADYDAVYVAGGRGPEYIRTYERVREILREFHRDEKPIASICHGLQVLVAVPEVIAGKKVAGLFTTEPEVALTDATYVPIGPKAALRDGLLVTAEGWTALAAFMREFMTVLGTEIIHHPVGALDQAAAAE